MKSLFNKLIEIFYECGEGRLGYLAAIIRLIIIGSICFGMICLEGWLLMLLWNWLAVELFGATVLRYLVCVKIMVAVWFIRQIVFGIKTVKVETDDD